MESCSRQAGAELDAESTVPETQPLLETGFQKEVEDMNATRRAAMLAPLLAVLSCILFCFNGELLQALQTHLDASQGHPSVLLNLTLCHLGGLAFLSRAPAATVRPVENSNATPSPPATRSMSLLFAFMLMAYNYAWLSSARFLAVGLTNAVFQTSVAMVYCASVLLFAEPLASGRMMGVALALVGTGLAGVSTSAGGANQVGHVSIGVTLALLAAVGITLYQVLFKYLYGHLKNDVNFLMHFFAWISIWHVVLIGPLMLLADSTGFEKLEFPKSPLAIGGTIVSAVIASTVNALYLCLVMWGSPMLLPCTSVLTVPLTVGLDALLHGVVPTRGEAVGHVLVVLSVALILDLPAFLPQRPRKVL